MCALNLIRSPEIGKVWEIADRFDLTSRHARVRETGERLSSPQGLRQHRANDDKGANLAYRVVLGKDPEYEHST